MSSRGKKKTTMAKLHREARLRERRFEKQARKEARRDAAAAPDLEMPPTEGYDGPQSEGYDSAAPAAPSGQPSG
jgi:hypothetical protein